MVTDRHIDLKSMDIDTLAGVVNMYPWFGAARKELCLRISQLGGKSMGDSDYSTNALYIGSRRIVSDIVRAASTKDYSDKDLENVLKALTASETIPEANAPAPAETPKRAARAAGGDFFSQDDYDSVRDESDELFHNLAVTSTKENTKEKTGGNILDAFCTETLARIYIEQGHFEPAKYIYSQLILRYPEKSAYFASLIEKLGQLTDN